MIKKDIYILYKKIEISRLRKLKEFSNYGIPVKLPLQDFELIRIKPKISDSGFVYQYSKTELKKLKENR